MRGIRSERPDDQFSIFGPSERYGVERVSLGRKPDIARDKLRTWAAIQRTAALRRTFAVDFPGPGEVDRLAVERHPGAKFVEEGELIVVLPAVTGQRYIQQQITVFAHDIDQKMSHGLGRAITMIFVDRPAVMPTPDAGVRLPWIRFHFVRLAHFEIADQSAQHRAGNVFDIEDRVQFAPVSADVGVVVVRHDMGCKLRHAEPHV